MIAYRILNETYLLSSASVISKLSNEIGIFVNELHNVQADIIKQLLIQKLKSNKIKEAVHIELVGLSKFGEVYFEIKLKLL